MLFLNILKRNEQKNCRRSFQIRKHPFLNNRKGYKETNCPWDFQIRQDAFFKYIRRVLAKKFSQVFSDS